MHRGKDSTSNVFVAAAVAILFLILPLLYVLSIGPVGWLTRKGYISGDEGSPAYRFYTPVIWLHERVAPVELALDWYMELWDGG